MNKIKKTFEKIGMVVRNDWQNLLAFGLVGLVSGVLVYFIDRLNQSIFLSENVNTLQSGSDLTMNVINFAHFVSDLHLEYLYYFVLIFGIPALLAWYLNAHQTNKTIRLFVRICGFAVGMWFAVTIFVFAEDQKASFTSENFFGKQINYLLILLIQIALSFAIPPIIEAIVKHFSIKNDISVDTQPKSLLSEQPIDFSVLQRINTNNEYFGELYKDLRGFNTTLNDRDKVNVKDSSYSFCVDGSWGSGKTSFLQMLKDFNQNLENGSKPISELIKDKKIVWVDGFNPWNFGNSSDLISDFFNTLAEEIDENFGIQLDGNYKEYVEVVSPIVEGNGFLMSILNTFKGEHTSQTLKNRLKKILSKLDAKIVFVLDDIDRLEPKEVMEVLRLVKSVADLPNLIFILEMDYNRVSKIISREYHEEYENYLQKIVSRRLKVQNYDYKDLFRIYEACFEGVKNASDKVSIELSYEYYRILIWHKALMTRVKILQDEGHIQLPKMNDEYAHFIINNEKNFRRIYQRNFIEPFLEKYFNTQFDLNSTKYESNDVVDTYREALMTRISFFCSEVYFEPLKSRLIDYIALSHMGEHLALHSKRTGQKIGEEPFIPQSISLDLFKQWMDYYRPTARDLKQLAYNVTLSNQLLVSDGTQSAYPVLKSESLTLVRSIFDTQSFNFNFED